MQCLTNQVSIIIPFYQPSLLVSLNTDRAEMHFINLNLIPTCLSRITLQCFISKANILGLFASLNSFVCGPFAIMIQLLSDTTLHSLPS